MAIHKWNDLRKQRFSSEHIAEVDWELEKTVVEMNLQRLRQVLGKTQEEVSLAAAMTQSQLSKAEHGTDHLVSTLRRVVEALGGELEIVARFEDRMVKLSGV